MAESYLGEIRMFAGPWVPKNWAYCDGQLLPIAQYSSLYALLGTAYGGDGYSYFALPDMRGRVPAHMGQGPDLSQRFRGQRTGAEWAYLTTAHVPSHDHAFLASNDPATDLSLAGKVLAKTPVGAGDNFYALPGGGTLETALIDGAIRQAGGDQPHPNIMPYMCINFIIALTGTFPPRS